MLFFKRALKEKDIYNLAYVAATLKGPIGTSFEELSKYSRIDRDAYIALCLNLIHFSAFCAHGPKGAQLANSAINKAMIDFNCSAGVKTKLGIIAAKGPEYLHRIAMCQWGESPNNPFDYFASIENLLDGILIERYTESQEFITGAVGIPGLMKMESIIKAEAYIQGTVQGAIKELKKYK